MPNWRPARSVTNQKHKRGSVAVERRYAFSSIDRVEHGMTDRDLLE